jgi:hypothetical protein
MIPNKIKKNQNKTSMVKDIGAFRDSQTPSWLSGLRTMYLLNLT